MSPSLVTLSLLPRHATADARRPLRLGTDVAQPARVSRRASTGGRRFGV